MKIIDKYIMKKFLTTFFVSLLLIIVIVVVFDLSEKLNKFIQKEVPLIEIVRDYYLNFIPYFINMFSPLFVFITVVFFTSKMAANSEIIAILSGGISYKRMLVPYLASAAIIALLSLGLNMYIIPRANAVRVPFEQKYTSSRSNADFNRRNIHYQIAPGQFVYVESFYSWNNTANRMTVESIVDNELVSKLSCESATWDSTAGCWHMRKWTRRDYKSALSEQISSGPAKDTVLALTVDDFYRNDKTVQTLTMKQLDQLIDTQNMRGDPNVMYALIEKNRRFTLPFSAFILTIMGVSLTSRKRRGGIGWNLALGIGLAFLYILFLRFSEMFVYTGALPPGLALWLPNFVSIIIAAFLYRVAPKSYHYMTVRIINKSSNALPEYATALAAGMDVRADNPEAIVIEPLGRAIVPTGLFLEIPAGYEVQVRPRSGLAARSGLTVLNSPGTIDADYRGELKVILVNLSSEPFEVKRGERIAQIVLARHERIEWEPTDELSASDRGEGGFGSTGTK